VAKPRGGLLNGNQLPRVFDLLAYLERNQVEHLINRLEQWRPVATRYEKLAENCQAMGRSCSILLWL
jgi:transposase